MTSKKKLLKGIESIEKLIKVHEIKLDIASSPEGRQYLIKDIERLKKQKIKKEQQVKEEFSEKIDKEIKKYKRKKAKEINQL